MRPLFTQSRVADSAAAFLETVLAGAGRRTAWTRAALAGDSGPWRQQALLGRDRWCADALRDVVRAHVVDHLGADDAVLALGETTFAKQGRGSCGVAWQPAGRRQRVLNCQVAVFAAYVSAAGAALIDRGLHLPADWTSDPDRMTKAGVPPGWDAPSTRALLAARVIERTLAAGPPTGFVTADAGLAGHLAPLARAAGKGLLIAIDGSTPIGSPLGRPHVGGSAAEVARRLPFSAWRRLPGPAAARDREEWATCELAERPDDATQPDRRRALLVRRGLSDGGISFHLGECPVGTPLDTLAAVERRSRALGEIIRLARVDHGLDHNETRSWRGWHRHVGLVMMALAVRAAVLRPDSVDSITAGDGATARRAVS